MNRKISRAALLVGVLALVGCATEPMGPTAYVMPAPYKPFEVFAQDQQTCEAYASSQVSGQANAVNNQAVAGALIGAALGAGLGAAVSNGRGRATGVGAAYGAIAGTAIGASNSYESGYGIQGRYDNAYTQCMYARGNQVPGYSAPYYAPPPPRRYR